MRVGHAELCIPTIQSVASKLRIVAEVLSVGHAIGTRAASLAKPRDAHTLAVVQTLNTRAKLDNSSNDFVTED